MRLAALLLVALLALAGCKREARDYRPAPPFSSSPTYDAAFEQNAYVLSGGKRLFIGMNCQGCHGLGGGGMGPALMDAEWIYGYEPGQVFATISKGRPNGMPAFGGPEGATPDVTVAGTLPAYQRWQLVAYVGSLSGHELRVGTVVGGAVGLTVVILFVFLISDFVTGREIDALADPDPVKVRVTGHQWWWEVRYEAPTPSDIVTTANELHVPVGRPVHFDLTSSDVIHSFWVPNLHGKTDLIPRYTTHTTIRADRPGTYWGQCAEFCGLQHANMRLLVVAEPEDDFQKWLAAQRQPAPEPESDSQKRGQQVFLTRSCVLCHTVGGTPAQARVGPELTHLAGRSRIAAGTLPNTRGHLAGWVADAQRIKPGVRMPVNPLASDELQALLDYLESLK